MKLPANQSRFWSRLIATMKSWELSNGSAKASVSFATRRFTSARMGPRSMFRWQFRQSEMRPATLSARQKSRGTSPDVFEQSADAPHNMRLQTCSLPHGRWPKWPPNFWKRWPRVESGHSPQFGLTTRQPADCVAATCGMRRQSESRNSLIYLSWLPFPKARAYPDVFGIQRNQRGFTTLPAI